MTERERLLEKIRKVQALANRGADGEKQSAAALLDRLMTQYGIDEALKLQALMAGMGDHTRRPVLGSGVGP